MGSCCSVATGPPELNPDGEPKAAQTPMQVSRYANFAHVVASCTLRVCSHLSLIV